MTQAMQQLPEDQRTKTASGGGVGRRGAPTDAQRDTAATPIRTCIGCHVSDTQGHLVRMVVDGAGRIRIDCSRMSPLSAWASDSTRNRCVWQPGRGAYVHPANRCIDAALHKGTLGRALRRKVTSDDGLRSLIRECSEGSKEV